MPCLNQLDQSFSGKTKKRKNVKDCPHWCCGHEHSKKEFKYFLITGLIPIILAKEWNWRGRHRFWPKKPIKAVNISILYIIRNFYIFQTIFGYEQEAYFCPSKFSCFFHFWTIYGRKLSWSWNFCTHSKLHAFNNDSNKNNKTNSYHNSTLLWTLEK